MAQEIINNGAFADDGTGDTIFTAFEKTNANFTELYGDSDWQIDSGFYGTLSSGNPVVSYDTNDYTTFDRAANQLKHLIGSTVRFLLEAAGLTIAGKIRSTSTGGVGYDTGAGGAQTQSSSKSTAVTLNKAAGKITMNGASLGLNTTVSFTFNNSEIGVDDVVMISIASAGTAGAYVVRADQISAGSCRISLTNITLSSKSEALVLNYVVLKGAHA